MVSFQGGGIVGGGEGAGRDLQLQQQQQQQHFGAATGERRSLVSRLLYNGD